MNIRYFVSDVEKSIAFYRDILGFDLIEQWGPAFGIVALDDSCQLWLSGPGTSAATAVAKDGSVASPGGWNRIVVPLTDLEESLPRLIENGVIVRVELVKGPGGKQVLIEDPDGNPIELFDPNPKL